MDVSIPTQVSVTDVGSMKLPNKDPMPLPKQRKAIVTVLVKLFNSGATIFVTTDMTNGLISVTTASRRSAPTLKMATSPNVLSLKSRSKMLHMAPTGQSISIPFLSCTSVASLPAERHTGTSNNVTAAM